MILHELLTKKGMTGPSELGRQLGISKQHAWLLWHGKVLPGPELLKALHERLKIPLTALMDLERAEPLKPRGPKPKAPEPPPTRKYGRRGKGRGESDIREGQ
jgi:transcriptional regulator with XRE-family HTH domain